MVGDVIYFFSVKELVLWNKKNTEIIVAIIKKIFYALLHRRRDLACTPPTQSKGETLEMSLAAMLSKV